MHRFLVNVWNKDKNIFHKLSSRFKQYLFDLLVVCPYVFIDTTLYFSTAYQFINTFDNNEDDFKWNKPQYIILLILSLLLFLCYFSTFSQTNSRLFNLPQTDTYSNVKNKLRKVIGVPAALIKTSIGAAAFYLFIEDRLPQTAVLGLSITAWVAALPAMTALLWSNHEKSLYRSIDNKSNVDIKRLLKYLIIHVFTFFYSIDNTSLYFWATINAPKKLGIINHSLSNYQNTTEQVFYYLSYLISVFPLVAVHIAYAHLSENMFGLTNYENKKWNRCKAIIKKIAGPIAVGTKVINAGISSYGFFQAKIPVVPNILLNILGSASGLITQYSILGADPLRNLNINSAMIGDNNAQNTKRNFNVITEELDDFPLIALNK